MRDRSIVALQALDGGSDEDRGRCLVGAIIVEFCCEGEEDVSSDPERCEEEGDSDDGAADRLETQQQGTGGGVGVCVRKE